jgi:methionyl-tRNA formyltransferase
MIDWHWPADRVHNLVRGLHPWPHAFTFLGGHRFIVIRASASAGDSIGAAPPGTILEAKGDRFLVATGDGALRILEIQAEGRRLMAARDFLAGHRLAPGDRFTAAP